MRDLKRVSCFPRIIIGARTTGKRSHRGEGNDPLHRTQQLAFRGIVFPCNNRGVLIFDLLARCIGVEVFDDNGFDDGVNLDCEGAFRLRVGHLPVVERCIYVVWLYLIR